MDRLPDLLLLDLVGARRIGGLPWPRAVDVEPDPVPWDRTSGGVERLDVLVRRVRRAQQHAVRLDAAHVARLEVAQRNDEAVSHGFDGDVFHEPGDDGAGLRIAQVDGLDVEAE